MAVPSRFRRLRAAALGSALLVALPLTAVTAAEATGAPPTSSPAAPGWVNGWQGSPTAGGTFDPASCPADTGLEDQTVRNIVPVSTSGSTVRIRVSNAFGEAPLRVGAASVAVAGAGAAVAPGTLRPVLFSGRPDVLVAQGGEALSDPVRLDVTALQRLSVSVFLPEATGPATQHNNSRETNYLGSSDRTGDPTATQFDRPISCWLFASGVDVLPGRSVVGTVVALGDSITDGDQSTVDADQRYPDWLARRFAAVPGRTLAVSNAGIGGNELLYDRVPELFGVSAPARLPRDVLTQAGVRAVILTEGINDIGAENARAEDVIAVYQQLITQVHAAGLPIYGGTLVPFGGSNAVYGGGYGTPAADAQRRLVNDWIRSSGAFDGVIDFDAALRDPADTSRLLPVYDSGDHLHPSDAGYRRMAETVDLGMLLRGATHPR
ncbi:SGNH/GDSL hydrolase family protein [Modestobacter muralis]|uniref:SGNH/GDSL hydrolase family protein n=1 Tax=Modestobacter muralis TaxID=1608614 RepID=A0A6P0EPZ4_9ACTN|nr:SGNH/GDSL hydrolase family protein [Modestobacter muralis]NEK92853.1 SGNH/GDSL hydrolase family protein [Modestobacter muralis]NEN49620.1 SGNH/GDSL hydrolase family protein [Modestobacter muralis]